MNDWQEEMKFAMKMMKSACAKNEDWDSCCNCPFDEYCTILMSSGGIDPYKGIDWEDEL